MYHHANSYETFVACSLINRNSMEEEFGVNFLVVIVLQLENYSFVGHTAAVQIGMHSERLLSSWHRICHYKHKINT